MMRVLFVETVGDRGSGRLDDNTEDLVTSGSAGILGSLTLSFVEVCVDGDDSPGDGNSEGVDLEGEVLDVGLDLRIIELATDEALRVEDGVDGVHRDLDLRGDETLGVGEGDIGRVVQLP